MEPAVILFPHEPFSPARIDENFKLEYEAARTIGFRTALYDHEAVESGDVRQALKSMWCPDSPRKALLRGWMLAGDTYRNFYHTVAENGYLLLTSPDAYEEAHYLPFYYPKIQEHTARSAWMSGDNAKEAWDLYQDFSHTDAIIKDWVKSAKHKWDEAFFIPADTQESRFMQIFENFRRERGSLFNRGVVLREFMPVAKRGGTVDGYPLVEESRLFFWQGQVMAATARPGPTPMAERERWETLARKFASPFVTIDVARLTDGSWRIVEAGDGGVSGLPLGLQPEHFYASLWNHMAGERPGDQTPPAVVPAAEAP